jgi:hypothetical protein
VRSLHGARRDRDDLLEESLEDLAAGHERGQHGFAVEVGDRHVVGARLRDHFHRAIDDGEVDVHRDAMLGLGYRALGRRKRPTAATGVGDRRQRGHQEAHDEQSAHDPSLAHPGARRQANAASQPRQMRLAAVAAW